MGKTFGGGHYTMGDVSTAVETSKQSPAKMLACDRVLGHFIGHPMYVGRLLLASTVLRIIRMCIPLRVKVV